MIGNVSLTVAAFLMLLAAVWDSITVANGDYRHVLWQALLSVIGADIICLCQFVIRRGIARWIAVLITSPSFFIVPQALRRLSI
jgi:hypothetical protein